MPCPKLDIGPAFAAAVVAALNGSQKAKDYPFSPYANDIFFLHGARCSHALSLVSLLGASCNLQTFRHPWRITNCMRSERTHRRLLYHVQKCVNLDPEDRGHCHHPRSAVVF